MLDGTLNRITNWAERNSTVVFVALALLTSGCSSVHFGETNRLRVSIDHSEWHPSSIANINLDTGRYIVRAGPSDTSNPHNEDYLRQNWTQDASGRLSVEQLDRLRDAAAKADTNGLFDAKCDADPDSVDYMIITNGGMPSIALRWAGRTQRHSKHLKCWTAEANALRRDAGEVFDNIAAGRAGNN
ncbi:hypothetical protein [Pontixanthobacter sp. CEM42]|uniref:hypothetical protein n=1 Tax=Pontixanthobacter sp. CEM42 TaxID=2792077 RepID=UPI001ADFAA8F|nr:hypothetical protein [Pontixanthobacter sp. CEM42]